MSADTIDEQMRVLEERARKLPFWKRPRRLRRQIAATLMLGSLLAVGVFGVLNYVAADQLLTGGTRGQLESVAESRARSVELGTQRLLNQFGALTSDRDVTLALTDFTDAFAMLDDATLEPDQSAQLDDFYRDVVVEPLNDTQLLEQTVTLDDVRPRTDAGRFVQLHYTVPDPVGPPDSTSYADAIRTHDAYLSALAGAVGASDLLLIDASDEIVYSTEKRIDLGTSLDDGPYRNSALAALVTEQLEQVRAGDALLTDFTIYLPKRAEPALFVAATIRSGTEIVGTLALDIPNAGLDAITTAGQNWGEIGLGDGESYVVASDLLLQSTSRLWIEDPEAYLEQVDDAELRRAIEVLGSPVGLQPVDTEPVRRAFRGEPFTGTSRNYLGQATFSSSTAIDIPGVEWVLVTDVPRSSIRAPLFDYLTNLGIAVLIVVPVAALVGIVLARRLSRPIGPAVDAARAVADGARDLDLPPRGNDEFGDLGRRLGRMALTLGDQERALEAEYDRRRDLMLAVLPPHLVGDDGEVAGTGERVDVGTIIAVGVTTDFDTDSDDEMADHLSGAATVADQLAAHRSVVRVRIAADRYLFMCGQDDDDDGVREGLAFAAELAGTLRRLGEDAGLALAVHVGVSTGAIATGVLERGSLTFGAWGEPVRRALAISALSKSDEILVDAPTAALADTSVPSDHELTAVTGIVDLDDEPMDLYALAPREPSDT